MSETAARVGITHWSHPCGVEGLVLLGFAGLPDGLHATTHWRSLDWMKAGCSPRPGISAGIDMSLKVVARHCGETIAPATAAILDPAQRTSAAPSREQVPGARRSWEGHAPAWPLWI